MRENDTQEIYITFTKRFCPRTVLASEAKTRGGTLGFPACIHTRNVSVVGEAFLI